MPTVVPIEDLLRTPVPLLDVRSPGEFARGHVPGAHNLPLFSDAERAAVGTLYKQEGHEAAVLAGLRFVGPKLADLVAHARQLAPDGEVAVHCWRGGERSASVGWLLERAGFKRVVTLQRGYKAFRRFVLGSLSRKLDLKVLGGYTGTGKTELMGKLRALGEQTLDLEALARHKGSSFGGIGAGPQPSNEHFENLIWDALRPFDPQRTIWVEDESRSVGQVKVPDPLYAQMHSAPVVFIQRPVEVRVERLVQEYGALPADELAAAITRIQKRLGPQHAKAALAALAAGDLHAVVRIVLTYYDKSYARSLTEPGRGRIKHLHAGTLSLDDLVHELITTHEHIRK